MITLASLSMLVNRQAANVSASSTQAIARSSAGAVDQGAKKTEGSSTISSLAQQLSESAARAEVRDASLSRKELGMKAVGLLGQITGDDYFAKKAHHDAEVPNTDDPELLARAREATEHVSGNGANPFAGLSRHQLALITYDTSGAFTVNERRAAWSEAFDQESTWRQKVVARAWDEINATGKLTNFFSAVLDHYESLPGIEQVQYPSSYRAQLQGWIDLDFNYWTHSAEGRGSPQSVLDKILDRSAFSEPKS
ncbi:hypothetical protein [Pseudomonas akapageensis]|uniref:hypothetical protein n=1 Tax=Pseudomonas akapageensis TaxID=2609961 RepID=UPI001408AAF9|nr:hypothetical protein [Pseudomonas akapageensis]